MNIEQVLKKDIIDMTEKERILVETDFEKCVLAGRMKESLLYKSRINRQDGSIGTIYIKEYRILKNHRLM